MILKTRNWQKIKAAEDSKFSESIDEPDEQGLTGLMWASAYGQLGSAKLLLKAGANKNLHGNNGETALHLAAAYGHHDLVKLLLNHGADSNASDEVIEMCFTIFFIPRGSYFRKKNYFTRKRLKNST